jgi:hypothetical protein
MPATSIPIDEAGDFFAKQVAKAIKVGAANGMFSAALRMVNIIQTQIIPAKIPEPTNRGVYKASWRAHRESTGVAYYENTSYHAPFIEYGVRASSVKVGRAMIEALTEWVRMKGLASGPAAIQMAWAIANRMRVRGIFNNGNGLRIMETANAEHLVRVIEEEVQREVDRAITKL